MGEIKDLFVELSSVKNTFNIFNDKNVMFRNIVHSEWVYLTHSGKNAMFSNVPLNFQSNVTRQYLSVR